MPLSWLQILKLFFSDVHLLSNVTYSLFFCWFPSENYIFLHFPEEVTGLCSHPHDVGETFPYFTFKINQNKPWETTSSSFSSVCGDICGAKQLRFCTASPRNHLSVKQLTKVSFVYQLASHPAVLPHVLISAATINWLVASYFNDRFNRLRIFKGV